ncbi:putative DNA-binding protein [Fusobacterium varium]|nr:putative DNA-binding protein [Fusobacterium varium]
MKETDFIKEYKVKRNLKNIRTAKEKIEVFWETVADVLKENERLTFKGWGNFGVKETKEKMFMNPRTKKLERLTAGKKILFRQGKILKKKIND